MTLRATPFSVVYFSPAFVMVQFPPPEAAKTASVLNAVELHGEHSEHLYYIVICYIIIYHIMIYSIKL